MKKKFNGLKYPTKAEGKIPSFNNIEEEAEFWDTHNFINYEAIIKVISYEDKYLDDMAKLFAESYSDKSGVWSMEQARKRVWENVRSYPECNLVAISENNDFVGGILCQKYVNYNGDALYIDSIQVKKSSRKSGVGKALLEGVIKKAKGLGTKSIFMYVDSTNKWLNNWYKNLGFEKTRWVAYASKITDLKI